MSGNWTSVSSPGASGTPLLTKPQLEPLGPPYPPNSAIVGGTPTPGTDDPISAVLAFFFLLSAAIHMGIFQYNRRNGFLFAFSAMMFAFSIIRAAALFMRIAWASLATNIRVAMAANILTQAGTVIVFIVNLFFAQRIVRAYHPAFGWSNSPRMIFRFLVGSVVACLIMVIAVTVQSFYTLDQTTRDNDRIVQLFSGTYLAVLAFLPIPIVIIAALIPHKQGLDKFGEGSWRAKMSLLIFTSALLTIGAGFRVGTNYSPRPLTDPAWYHGKAPYYVFNYVIDLIVSYTYIAAAFHRRYHVPNGAKGPGSYTTGFTTRKEGLYGSKFSLSMASTIQKPPKSLHKRPYQSEITLRNNSLLSSRHPSPGGFYPGLVILPATAHSGPSNPSHYSYGGSASYNGRYAPRASPIHPQPSWDASTANVDAESLYAAERQGNINDMIGKISREGSRVNSLRYFTWAEEIGSIGGSSHKRDSRTF